MSRTVWPRLVAGLLVLVALLLVVAHFDRVAVEPAPMEPAALDARGPPSEPLVAQGLAGPSEMDAESGGGDTRAIVEATLRVRAEFVGGTAAERERVEVWARGSPRLDGTASADGLSDGERAALGLPGEPGAEQAHSSEWIRLRPAELGDHFAMHVGNQSEIGEPPLEIQAFLQGAGTRAVSARVHLGSWPSDAYPLRCEFTSGVRVRVLDSEGDAESVEILAFPASHVPTAFDIEAVRSGEQSVLLHRNASVGEWLDLPLPTGTRWRLAAGAEGKLAFDADDVLVVEPGASRELRLKPLHAASYVLVDDLGKRIQPARSGNGAALGRVRLGGVGGAVSLPLGLLAGLPPEFVQPGTLESSTTLTTNVDPRDASPQWFVAAELLGYEWETFSVPYVSAHLCVRTEIALRRLEGPLGEIRIAVHGSDTLRRVSSMASMELWMVRADGTERFGPIPLPWPWQGDLVMPFAHSGSFRPELHWGYVRAAPQAGGAVEVVPGRPAAIEFDLREAVATFELALPPGAVHIGQTLVVELESLGVPPRGLEFFAAYAAPGESPILGPFQPGEYEARLFEPAGLAPADGRPAVDSPVAPAEPPSWRFHAEGGAHLVFALH